MNIAKGIFPIINAIIHESQKDGCEAIDKDRIEEEVRKRYPIQTIDRESLEHSLLDSYIGIALAQHHYYSVFRKKKIFAYQEKVEVLGLLEQLENNRSKDLSADRRKLNEVINLIKKQKEAMENQFTFDETFEKTGEFKENLSEEELFEILKELCKPADERRQAE